MVPLLQQLALALAHIVSLCPMYSALSSLFLPGHFSLYGCFSSESKAKNK